MATLAGGKFVGRQREMGKLKAVLEDALSGQGQLLMLVGEPGIGKTRTAQELAAHAETRGAQVLWGWCYEEEGAPPYWPWLQPIRSYVQQRDPEQLRSEMGLGAASIAEIIPEVRVKLPGLEAPLTLEPEQARFRLFDSITTFLRNAAQSQPLMLVLDDLHWADNPSLLLLQFLTRQLERSSLLVVGCYRDLELSRQHPLSGTLARLSRLPLFQRVLLRGLGHEDTGKFIEANTGIIPHPKLVDAIYAHTEGNPFFIKEILRDFSERGELEVVEVGGPRGISMPEGVREAIGQRLNRLSERCNEILITASIIGREFDFHLLHALSNGITEEQLLKVIDEALAAHLIEESPGGRERYRFSHVLIQESLAEGLSISRKVRWHARIGKALEELYGADVEAHAAELAYHFSEAVTVSSPDKLVRYSLLAGEQALATYAYEEAEAHFQRGLAAREGRSVDAETADLLFGLGRAQAVMMRSNIYSSEEVGAILSRAFDYYAEAKDLARAVAVAEYPFYPVAGQIIGAAQLIARALTLVSPDSHEAGRLLCRYGSVIGDGQSEEEGGYASAQGTFDRALAIAQQKGDVALEVRTLANVCSLNFYYLRFQECLEKSLWASEVARSACDLQNEVAVRYWGVIALLCMGDFEGTRLHAAAMLAQAERLGDHSWITTALWANENLYRLEGNWQVARDFSNRSLAMSPFDPRLLSSRAVLEYQIGKFVQGETYLSRLLEVVLLTPAGPNITHAIQSIVIPLIAHITGVAERFEAAEAAAQAVLSASSATPFIAKLARTGLALLALLRRDISATRELYDALEPHAGTMSSFTIADDRLLGLLSATQGRLVQAIAHFEDALAFCRQAGYRPELAWTCYDYADVLLQHHNFGDPTKAMSLLDEASSIACELGMRPLMERVQSLQEKLAVRPGSAPVYPNGLSQREVEVLRLMALGKSNRDISDELVISLRTVEHHVTSILNKTGAANRTEAAAYAARHRLVSW
jgi:DNA-binding CsgD family transcriptional regulator/tetratricopeptide (TPR) repeat protein